MQCLTTSFFKRNMLQISKLHLITDVCTVPRYLIELNYRPLIVTDF